jgi:hypothetical protein
MKETGYIDTIYSLSVKELIQHQAEEIRVFLGFDSKRCFTVTEEENRFIVSVHTSIGSTIGVNQRGSLLPTLGVTQEPYLWTWGKADVPYYCAHCCLWWEIMPIEDRGYPVRVHEYPENRHEPCRIIYYKNPKLIPEKYFRRVGFEKTAIS